MLRGAARVALAGSLAAAAGTLAGCGSDPERPAEPAERVLEQAVQNTRSGQARIALASELRAGEVTLEGPFALGGDGTLPAADLEFEARVAGAGAEGRLISTGERAFVDFFGETYAVEPVRAAALGAELELIAGELSDAFRDPVYGEVEEVAGVDSVAIRPRSGPEDITVWVGIEERSITRIRGADVPAAGGTASFDAEITDPGAGADVEAPPGGPFQPLSDLIDRLGGLSP